MKFTKILINKQLEKSRKEIVKLENLCEKLNERFVSAFNDLEIGELTPELLSDALLNKSAEIIVKVWKKSESEFGTITNKAVKAMFNSAIQSQINDFLAVSKFNIDTKLFQFLTVKDGAIELIDGYKETIEESNHYCIETEQEKAIYDALIEISNGINKFNSLLGVKAKTVFYNCDDFMKFINLKKDGSFELDDENNYKFLAN